MAGILWEPLGCLCVRTSGNSWEHIGCFGNSWEYIGYFGKHAGYFGKHIGYFGNSLEHIGCFGNSWEHIGYFGTLWEHIGNLGVHGNTLVTVGTHEITSEWLGGLCQGWEVEAAVSCFLGLRAYLHRGTAQELPYACEGKLQNTCVHFCLLCSPYVSGAERYTLCLCNACRPTSAALTCVLGVFTCHACCLAQRTQRARRVCICVGR